MEENELIENIEFEKKGKRTTVCFLTLKNGHELIGVAYSMSDDHYDEKLGREYSLSRAVEQIPALLEFLGYEEEENE